METRARTRLRTALRTIAVAVALAGLTGSGGIAAAGAAALPEPVSVARFDVVVPAEGVSAWIDVESGGTQASALSLVIEQASTAGVPVSPTSFGAGAVVPVTPGATSVYVSSTIAITPDVSITVVDASGVVLAVVGAQVPLSANPDTDPGTIPGDGEPVPSDITDPGTSRPAGSRGGDLADTGAAVAPFVVLALLLAAGGALMLARTRRTGERSTR
ncbi:hypothetical protein N1028_06460 [Herbiconiux sp. CPCC 203407]|uniref:LPXTG cell wall anchor domain-containing protein n=1 Tax=Herbiconiux oxytropis TaxID=2970915 RepID=A0AA41XG16_9MICO|nr:hypothetical protein [Herbiconiux oxytropis]MCS5721951.1 hypothetical protein [Herbiconiux oxytropis]MCS5725534.1 hypothetical protein [Herbiconiux oxytropis]